MLRYPYRIPRALVQSSISPTPASYRRSIQFPARSARTPPPPANRHRSPGVSCPFRCPRSRSVGGVRPRCGSVRGRSGPSGPVLIPEVLAGPHRPRQPGCRATLSISGPGRVHWCRNCSRRFRSLRVPLYLRPIPCVPPGPPTPETQPYPLPATPQGEISTMNEIRPLPTSIYRRPAPPDNLRSGFPRQVPG